MNQKKIEFYRDNLLSEIEKVEKVCIGIKQAVMIENPKAKSLWKWSNNLMKNSKKIKSEIGLFTLELEEQEEGNH